MFGAMRLWVKPLGRLGNHLKMSNDPEDLGYSKPAPDPAQGEMFGEIATPPGERIKYPEKLAELERERRMRESVHPKWIASGKLSQAQADRQLAVLNAIIDDYSVRPWPQTKDFVAEWRPQAERVTFMGVRITHMHREELMAVVAYAKAALEHDTEKGEQR